MLWFRASVRLCVCALSLAAAAPLGAQTWDASDARALVDRAVERRAAGFADSSLRDWSARAHGFVFFLGQIGEGLAEPPRLVKADQLELEVYWRLPNQSKQRIIGWRDQRDLPTDINYHRDHLGIAMGNFPDLIRLGEGDEVRDVPHPVSARGSELYEYALGDTLTITLSDRELRVVEVSFRPKDFRAARIVGRLFFEIGAADLVRMSFSFTRAAYIDTQLEDITVGIENSLLGGRWWLPVRQEIEIRRRATFLDFPARGIIRGRFAIDGYQFNPGLDPALFRAGQPDIVAAPMAVRDSFPWRDSLSVAIREVARPFALQDFDAVRAQATAIALGHVLTGLRQNQLAAGSISDFAHVNRVEGLALGAGAAFRSANEARELRLRAGVGTATGLVTGGAAFQIRRGSATWRLAGAREVRDLGDMPVISRAVNSLTSQEAGRDYGDYYFATGGTLSVTGAVGGRTTLRLEVGYERIDSLTAGASWARGAYARPNLGVREGEWTVARLTLKRRTPSFAVNRDFSGRIDVEGGLGPSDYLRTFAELRWQLPVGATSFLVRGAVGATQGNLPDHRAFVLGGRGTMLGEPFRGRRGARMAWGSAEWQIPVGIPEIRMGSFAGTGRRLTLAPNVAVGWTGGLVSGTGPATGADVSFGLGASWLHDLLRFDAGYGISSHRFGFSVDVSRGFWDIL
jgi:hypothetical protein